jgi:hypothetical protein
MMLRDCAAAAALFLFALSAPGAADPKFTEFDAPNGGSALFIPHGSINAKGAVAGHYFDSEGLEIGFVRTKKGAFDTLDTNADIYVEALNASGMTTGEYAFTQGYVSDADGNITHFVIPDSNDNGWGTQCFGINAHGTVTGIFSPAGEDIARGFIRDLEGNIVTFDGPGAAIDGQGGTFPMAINGDGDVASWTDDNSHKHAFLRSARGKQKALKFPNGTVNSRAYAINKSGLVGGVYDTHGFLRDKDGSLTPVDVDGASSTSVTGVNDDGVAVGTYVESGVSHGFIRAADGEITTFDAPDAALTSGKGTIAQAISAKGAVAGYYSTSDGKRHGFVRTP